MKKFLSFALSLVMILSLGVVAFADESAGDEESAASSTNTITLKKVYGLVGDSTAISPAETFSFESADCTNIEYAGTMENGSTVTVSDAPSVTVSSVSYSAGEAGGTNNSKDITITYGDFPAVGIYTYTFKEKNNDTAGVTYLNVGLVIVFNVTQGENGLVVNAGVKKADGFNKIVYFDDNKYSAGSLKVAKDVTGDFGEVHRAFDIKVKFIAPFGKTVNSTINYGGNNEITPSEWSEGSVEVTVSVIKDAPVTFTNIPYGVAYLVTEEQVAGYDEPSYENCSGTINSNSVTATVTNNKDGEIATGVSMDSIPYVVLLTVACLGLVVLFTKKRAARDF